MVPHESDCCCCIFAAVERYAAASLCACEPCQPAECLQCERVCARRALAATVCNPLELIKVRMQSRGNRHKSALHVLRSVVGTDGVLGLWKGTVPSAVRHGQP